MAKRDYYEILGVSKTAKSVKSKGVCKRPRHEIPVRTAIRVIKRPKLNSVCDKRPGEVLTDAQKTRSLRSVWSRRVWNKAVWAADLAAALMAADLVILLATFWRYLGGGRGRQRAARHRFITWILRRSGAWRPKRSGIPTPEKVTPPRSGAKAGTQPQTCPTCQRFWSGMPQHTLAVQQTCPLLSGTRRLD